LIERDAGLVRFRYERTWDIEKNPTPSIGAIDEIFGVQE